MSASLLDTPPLTTAMEALVRCKGITKMYKTSESCICLWKINFKDFKDLKDFKER